MCKSLLQSGGVGEKQVRKLINNVCGYHWRNPCSTPNGTQKTTNYVYVEHLRGLRQQSPNPKFQANLGYTAKPYLKRMTRKDSDMGQWVKKGTHHQV